MRRKVSKQLAKRQNRKYRRIYSRQGFSKSQQPKFSFDPESDQVKVDRMIAFSKVIKWGDRRRQGAMLQHVNSMLPQ
jgi:hypothetical protein